MGASGHAANRRNRAAFDVREQLGDETALADPGDADDRHEQRYALLPRALERVDELVGLPLTADEGRPR
jgi:hypothetical protein